MGSMLMAATRRAMIGAGSAALLIVAAAGCADDVAPSGAEGTSTTTSTSTMVETQSGGLSETGSAPEEWPARWYGDYYADLGSGISLGLEYQGKYLFLPLANMRLEAGSVTIESLIHWVDAESVTRVFATEPEGDALHVLPPNGEWDVLYPGAERVLLRPGAGCDELVLEAHGLPPPQGPVLTQRWWRGRICVVDPYDESIFDDAWMVDLCPGSVIACDE